MADVPVSAIDREEWFDVCNAADFVIGKARRSIVHAQDLLHRAVHIWVWDKQSRLVLQKRTTKKDQYPLCYTSSASGHVDAGEDYETAAQRELSEELGLSGPLSFRLKLPAGPVTAFEHTVLYELVTDATPQPDPEEILSLEVLTAAEITDRVSRHPEKFTPPFLELWRAIYTGRS